MNEKEMKIIIGAAEQFMKFGIKSMNMDDIARALGISKRTLYQYVTDKNDLVSKAMQLHCNLEDEALNVIFAKNLNAIDEIFEVSQFISDLLSKVHPSIHYDMEKYHPQVLQEMTSCRHKAVYECIHSNIEKGKSEGLYREDVNSDVIAKIYIAKMDVVYDGQLFPPSEISFAEVYLEYMRYHIRGMASAKGIEYLIEKVKEETK